MRARIGAPVFVQKKAVAQIPLFALIIHGGFDLDGALKAVPDMNGYPVDFDITDRKLHLSSAPRVESYRGFVFASRAETGPSLAAFLGSNDRRYR